MNILSDTYSPYIMQKLKQRICKVFSYRYVEVFKNKWFFLFLIFLKESFSHIYSKSSYSWSWTYRWEITLWLRRKYLLWCTMSPQNQISICILLLEGPSILSFQKRWSVIILFFKRVIWTKKKAKEKIVK